ncbi:2OG-Fe(II) oxygenase [Prochlorococcus sp. MIT 0916]|uniref:2OG-Fe(II) oxygenase n=1 Tax=Prochlorococcus sp. MIT 0916 TaxID=3082521 RepID=UPI0039B488C2
MKKVEINSGNKNPNFIGSWNIEPLLICDDLISYFELNKPKQGSGVVGSDVVGNGINLEAKDSVDISINPKEIIEPGNEVFKAYFDQLFECFKNYVDEWSFLEKISKRLEIGSFNLQRYKSGQHFKEIHTERFSLESLHRIFAFMTYLNDVSEGGSTYFNHYDLEIKPRKGLTLIWPAEWTHAHRGDILKKGSKYIITGWINFY